MKKRIPGTGDRNSNTPIMYTRKITVPSITLNKDDFKSLISILEKTGHTPDFDIETDQETLTFIDIQSLGGEKWPANIKRFGFRTGYSGPSISGYICSPNPFSFSNITLKDNDRDWISARSDELTRFLDQRRNLHHIFHNFKYALAQAVLLCSLLDYWLISYAIQRDSRLLIFLIVTGSIYGIWALYDALLPKVFPYLVLEPEFPTFYTRLRSALKYLIPSIFAGLVVQAIVISLS